MQSSTPVEPVEPVEPTGRILLIEDEPGIVDFLERGLRTHGFEVDSATDGLSGSQRALSEPFDLIVLDVMLPRRNGLEVLSHVRQAKPSMPVIILTARGEVEDRIAGLDAGAIDYLTKPFSIAELAARIRAQLRVIARTPTTTLTGGDVQVDLITRDVRRAGIPVRLSTTEFELLSYLLRHKGRVLSREQILQAVWGYDYDPGTNVVDVYVGYLRRKLRRRGERDPIVTVRSIGYRFDVPV